MTIRPRPIHGIREQIENFPTTRRHEPQTLRQASNETKSMMPPFASSHVKPHTAACGDVTLHVDVVLKFFIGHMWPPWRELPPPPVRSSVIFASSSRSCDLSGSWSRSSHSPPWDTCLRHACCCSACPGPEAHHTGFLRLHAVGENEG